MILSLIGGMILRDRKIGELMLTVDKTVLTPYTPCQMYDLVNDIEKYPEFLPGCPKTIVHQREEAIIQATVYITKGPVQHAFTTKNHLKPHEEVYMTLVSGPFKHLEGWWRFKEKAKQGTDVSFKLQFEFTNKLVQMAFGQMFQMITEKMMQAFVKRAKEVYGPR